MMLLSIFMSRCWTPIGCLNGVRSNFNSKKSIIWFIMISPAKFQPPNPSITASKWISRFWGFGRFIWKSKKLPNFFYFWKTFHFFVLDLIKWMTKMEDFSGSRKLAHILKAYPYNGTHGIIWDDILTILRASKNN